VAKKTLKSSMRMKGKLSVRGDDAGSTSAGNIQFRIGWQPTQAEKLAAGNLCGWFRVGQGSKVIVIWRIQVLPTRAGGPVN